MRVLPAGDELRGGRQGLGEPPPGSVQGDSQPHVTGCGSPNTLLFGFAEGQELTEHTSTQHALIQVLSGECEFFLAGQPHALKAGDFLYMPPNLAHAVKAAKQFSMLLTLFKAAPPSEAVSKVLNNLAIAA